jgi:hypothetical protein
MRLAAPGGGEVEQRRAARGFASAKDGNDGRGNIAQQFQFSPAMILICVALSICAVVIVPICYHKCRRWWWCGDNDDAIAAEQQRRGELEQNSTEGAVYEEKDTAEKKAAAKKMIKAYMLRKSIVSHCAIDTCCYNFQNKFVHYRTSRLACLESRTNSFFTPPETSRRALH